MADAPLIALAGFGRWAPNVLRDLRALGCEVVVVARPGGSAERAATEGLDVHATFDALPPVDGVVVATSIGSHPVVVDAALDLGVPVFVEKPLTADVASAEALAARAPDRLFVMDKWRYHHGIEALRDVVASGELGAPLGLLCIRDGRGDFRFDVDTIWRHVCHDLAIGLEILGDLPPARAAVAETVDGAPTGLQGLCGMTPWLSVSHSSTAPVRRREVRLSCERGAAWLTDAYDDHVVIAPGIPGEREPQRRAVAPEWPLVRELRTFVEHLGGGPAPRSSAADGLAIVRRLAELRALAGLDA